MITNVLIIILFLLIAVRIVFEVAKDIKSISKSNVIKIKGRRRKQ